SSHRGPTLPATRAERKPRTPLPRAGLRACDDDGASSPVGHRPQTIALFLLVGRRCARVSRAKQVVRFGDRRQLRSLSVAGARRADAPDPATRGPGAGGVTRRTWIARGWVADQHDPVQPDPVPVRVRPAGGRGRVPAGEPTAGGDPATSD